MLRPSVLLLTLLLAAPSFAAPKPATRPLLVGVTASFGGAQAKDAANAIATMLEASVGQPVDGKVFVSYLELADALAQGKVDLAFASPAVYARASLLGHPSIIRQAVHRGRSVYRTALFVRKDSGLKTLDQLKAHRIAWVQEGSASGNLYARALFQANGITPDKFFEVQMFAADHAAVCKAVYERRVDVGASYTDERNDGQPAEVDGCLPKYAKTMDEFTILAKGPPIPNDVLAAREGLAAAIVKAVGDKLDELEEKPEAAPVLKDAFRCDAFIKGDEKAFDALREAVRLVGR